MTKDRGRLVARSLLAAATPVVAVLAFAGLVLPTWALAALRRRDPLSPPGVGTGRARPGWIEHDRSPGPLADQRSIPRRRSSRPSTVGRLTWSIGCVALLLGANYGIGWAWDRATAPTTQAPDDGPGSTGSTRVVPDPRADAPAMAAYPWRDRYFADIQRTPGGYWPFTEYRPDDFSSPYVNIKGWLRKSYQPTGNPKTMPTVWMFSGSTTWGEGQRDDYTIASWISRLAERDGLPLRIDNYGERGWTHFQEMILYEQQLGLRPAPDLSIFYDGANEISAQSLLDEAVPTHVLAYTYAQKLTGQTVATRFVQQPERPSGVLSEAWRAYSEHSAIHKVAAWLRPSPAGASPGEGPGEEPAPPGFTGGQTVDDSGGVSDYQFDVQDGIDAGKVYARGARLTDVLSAEHQVRSLRFWQPLRYGFVQPYQRAIAELGPATIDLSTTLDSHPEAYLDGTHTNEEGARLVAVAIWERLEPEVRAWYEEHR